MLVERSVLPTLLDPACVAEASMALADVPEEAEEDEQAAAEAAVRPVDEAISSEDILMKWREHEGWKCSYRKSEPENASHHGGLSSRSRG